MVTRFKPHKLKLSIYSVFCIVLLLAFSSCDPYSNNKPTSHNYTRWVCSEYDTWFIVIDGETKGEGILNGKPTSLIFVFYSGSQVQIYSGQLAEKEQSLTKEALLWDGDGSFSKSKLILERPVSNQGLFNNESGSVTFVREDLTEEEVEALLPK